MANRVNIGPKGSKLDWDNWGKPVTDAINDHETRIATLEGQRILAYGERITNGTTTTTVEQGYFRIDGIQITNLQSYRIWTSPLVFESSVAGDLITVFLRANTAGAATTSSSPFTLLADDSKSASGNQKTKGLTVLYNAVVTGSLSILLSYVRSSGSGNVRINASAATPAQLAIEAMGANPTNSFIPL